METLDKKINDTIVEKVDKKLDNIDMDYEPYLLNDDDEKMIDYLINNDANKNDKKEEQKVGDFKQTSTIKLDDVADDEKFFDDFFDD